MSLCVSLAHAPAGIRAPDPKGLDPGRDLQHQRGMGMINLRLRLHLKFRKVYNSI